MTHQPMLLYWVVCAVRDITLSKVMICFCDNIIKWL